VNLFLACVLAVAGLVFGSFLNVCISRIPRDQSIVSPRSRCPHCGNPIRWYHNVPVVSYLLLRGRCADCQQRISLRYPAVELLTAALFVGCFSQFGFGLGLLKYCLLSFLLVGLVFMDAETGLLPHEFTYPGIVVGWILSWLVPPDSSGTEFLMRVFGFNPAMNERTLGLIDAVLAAAVGAVFFYTIWALYYLVRKRHGLGFGDIALIAMCGAFLGLKLTLFVLFAAPIAGSAFAIALLTFQSRRAEDRTSQMLTHPIRFGVFLGGCALIAIFWGEAAWAWYSRWINV
jgi:leader peptidase (prepilin peptidase)/N-methyltransferase